MRNTISVYVNGNFLGGNFLGGYPVYVYFGYHIFSYPSTRDFFITLRLIATIPGYILFLHYFYITCIYTLFLLDILQTSYNLWVLVKFDVDSNEK